MPLHIVNNRRFEVPEIDVKGNQATIRVPSGPNEAPRQGETDSPRSRAGTESQTLPIPNRTWQGYTS